MVKWSLRAHPPLHGESGVELDLHSWRRVGGDEKTARTGLVAVASSKVKVKRPMNGDGSATTLQVIVR